MKAKKRSIEKNEVEGLFKLDREESNSAEHHQFVHLRGHLPFDRTNI